MSFTFRDRQDAGRRLGRALKQARLQDVVVVGLSRGGIPVAAEVARALQAPLDVLVVRKLGAPGNPEFALGALTEDGRVWVHDEALQSFVEWSRPDWSYRDTVATELGELRRRVKIYRGGGPLIDVRGKTVIVVDDGLATGATMTAAVIYVRHLGATQVLAAVPVGAPESLRALRSYADEVICVQEPERFSSVGAWYEEFRQLTDDEVLEALRTNRGPNAAQERASPGLRVDEKGRGVAGDLDDINPNKNKSKKLL